MNTVAARGEIAASNAQAGSGQAAGSAPSRPGRSARLGVATDAVMNPSTTSRARRVPTFLSSHRPRRMP